MQAQLKCLSHTPLKGFNDPPSEVLRSVEEVVATMRAEVEEFDPEVVYLFWPDHLNGFFLDMMPQFCVGIAAESVGDYQTAAGPLNVPRKLAEACARAVVESDIDAGVSYRMQVDHGCAQPLEELTGALDRYPVIPIFINCVAPPVVSCRRARLLGEAVGQFARDQGLRSLFIGSGGLSHNPPVPQMATATEADVIERLINNRNPSEESRRARQARTIAAAQDFAGGKSALHPLNADWDMKFMSQLIDQDWAAIDAYQNADVTAMAGGSAHEVKTWIAAVAAMDSSCGGAWIGEQRLYREIPEWIAGFGALSGRSR